RGLRFRRSVSAALSRCQAGSTNAAVHLARHSADGLRESTRSSINSFVSTMPDHRGCQSCSLTLDVEQHQRPLFDSIAPSQRALVGEEPLDLGAKEALETSIEAHSTSSPSPSAISRSCSTAIFP